MRFIKKRWYWLLLVAMALLTLYMDVYVAKNVLDGDTSDYLYWARTIAQEKNPFTSDYYFSTELRLLDVSFIFSLFFFLTDSIKFHQFFCNILNSTFNTGFCFFPFLTTKTIQLRRSGSF